MRTTKVNWGGWLVLLALLALIGAVSSLTVSLTKSEANEVAKAYVPKMVAISLANKSLSQAFNETLQAVMESDQRTRRDLIASVASQSEKTTLHLDEFARLVHSPEEKQELEALITARQRYFEQRDRVFSLLSVGDKAGAEDLYQSSLRPAFAEYEKLSLALLQNNATEAIEKSQSVVNRAWMLQIIVASVAAALFLAGFGLGLFAGIHSGKAK
jgi:methyl-accepting chemotaxis protein